MPDGNRDDGPPTLVLSPLDSVVFVEAVLKAQRERDEVKLAFIESVLEEKFEGKGGASGGAGASGEWESPAREPREPVVEAGTIDTARAAVVDEWRSLAEAREMTEIDFPPASVVEYTPTPEMSDPVREEATPAPETTTNEP
jgi:hypothetical protein